MTAPEWVCIRGRVGTTDSQGNSGWEHETWGCLRTTDAAMEAIFLQDQSERVDEIRVEETTVLVETPLPAPRVIIIGGDI